MDGRPFDKTAQSLRGSPHITVTYSKGCSLTNSYDIYAIISEFSFSVYQIHRMKASNLLLSANRDIIFFSILSIAIHTAAAIYLRQDLDFGLIGLLLLPCIFYAWNYRLDACEETLLSKPLAVKLIIYTFLYLGGIFFVHILGGSVSYWLVQFLIPVLLIKIGKERIQALNFEWRNIFRDFWIVMVAALVIVPVLLFNVRDTEEILKIAKSWKILVYFPVSVLYMFLVAGFWEEFFFRGVILRSLLRLSENISFSIFVSSLLFAVYHFPMRYFNTRSPYFHDLWGSLAATINEQFIMGLFLGFVVYKSKNVWHGIWLHSMLNGISFVYQLSLWLKF